MKSAVRQPVAAPPTVLYFLACRRVACYIGKLLRRLIIVARDEVDLYDYIRRDQFGDETVRVITDRRSTARRLRMKAHIPDRRLGERRRYDIAPLLLTQGWAQVTLPGC